MVSAALCKEYLNLDVNSDRKLEEFFSECAIMKDFHHPNVLGLLGVVFNTPDCVPYLVLPFMKNGNLKDYLKSRRMEALDFNTLPQVGIKVSQIATYTHLCVFFRTCNCLILPRCVLILLKGWNIWQGKGKDSSIETWQLGIACKPPRSANELGRPSPLIYLQGR